MKKIFYFSLLSILLSSCVHYAWVSNEKAESLLDRDLTNCKHWSYEQFPPKAVHETRIDYTPINTYSRNGTYTGSISVPHTNIVTHDINIEARDNALKKCMLENSWRWEMVG